MLYRGGLRLHPSTGRYRRVKPQCSICLDLAQRQSRKVLRLRHERQARPPVRATCSLGQRSRRERILPAVAEVLLRRMLIPAASRMRMPRRLVPRVAATRDVHRLLLRFCLALWLPGGDADRAHYAAGRLAAVSVGHRVHADRPVTAGPSLKRDYVIKIDAPRMARRIGLTLRSRP